MTMHVISLVRTQFSAKLKIFMLFCKKMMMILHKELIERDVL